MKNGLALVLMCAALLVGIGLGLIVGMVAWPAGCYDVSTNDLDALGRCRVAEAQLLAMHISGEALSEGLAQSSFFCESCSPCDPRTASLVQALQQPQLKRHDR